MTTMEMVNQYEPEIPSFNYHHTSTTQLYPKTNPDNFHKIYPVSVALSVPFTLFCHTLTLATSHPFSILEAVTLALLPIVPISLLALSKGFEQIVVRTLVHHTYQVPCTKRVTTDLSSI